MYPVARRPSVYRQELACADQSWQWWVELTSLPKARCCAHNNLHIFTQSFTRFAAECSRMVIDSFFACMLITRVANEPKIES